MVQIETVVVRVDAESPESDAIDQAAEHLRLGELVAFPTETVYGLGANALNPEAVAGIYRAKGRPAGNPLIVHVLNVESAKHLAASWPDTAAELAKKFWPGPLTLVLPKTAAVPDIVTCGGSTVAVRSPSHGVARALLARTGFPLAAPSANLSEHLSPTTAAHVVHDLNGRIAMVLDSGQTSGGIESTVLALTGPRPTLLRPGLITAAEIEAVVGPIIRVRLQTDPANGSPAASPGTAARHYAPHAPLLVSANSADLVAELIERNEYVGWLSLSPSSDEEIESLTGARSNASTGANRGALVVVKMPRTAAAYASVLYARLHDLDALKVTKIVVDELPDSEDWMALRDRLTRASA